MGVVVWPDVSAQRTEIRLGSALYPGQLACTPDPPKVLYCIGSPLSLEPGLAVVGARKATPYGLASARLFAGWSAQAGYSVISGAAVGCDQEAHRAALRHAGRTVAVLGCGCDVEYPSGVGSLLRECVDAGGAVLSELPWESPPQRWAFRRRNRIIAGLSAALLVVEAGLPSGTFSTAEYALDAGRDVFAIPGSIFAPECRGPNRLIRQGATPLTDVSDLAIELERLIGPPRAVEAQRADLAVDRIHDDLLAALIADPMRPDDAAFRLGIDVVTVVRRIGQLEASGLVERYRDGRYGRARSPRH